MILPRLRGRWTARGRAGGGKRFTAIAAHRQFHHRPVAHRRYRAAHPVGRARAAPPAYRAGRGCGPAAAPRLTRSSCGGAWRAISRRCPAARPHRTLPGAARHPAGSPPSGDRVGGVAGNKPALPRKRSQPPAAAARPLRRGRPRHRRAAQARPPRDRGAARSARHDPGRGAPRARRLCRRLARRRPALRARHHRPRPDQRRHPEERGAALAGRARLRRHVLAIAPAQPQHGGAGALYLLLRKPCVDRLAGAAGTTISRSDSGSVDLGLRMRTGTRHQVEQSPPRGSSWRRSRVAATRAKRKVSARRRAGGERRCDAVAQHGRAERIRHHQATFFGDQTRRKIVRHGEIKPVRELSVGGPFAVGAEIGHRALDLDDDEVAGLAERENVGAPAVGEREFDQAGIAELLERAADAARQQRRRRGRLDGRTARS